MRLDCDTPVHMGQVPAADGHPLRYRAWHPSGTPRGTVVLLNGIMSHSGWLFPLVDPLVAAGLVVVGADRRGTGLDEVGRGDAPSAKSVVDDAMTIIDAAAVPDAPLFLVGWCWGSVLSLNLVRPLGDRLTGLVLVSPGLFPSAAVTATAAKNEAAAAGAPIDVPAIPAPIDDTMFTTGPYLDGFIRPDPHKLAMVTPRFRGFMGNLAMGAMTRLRRFDRPLLMLLAEGDAATDNDAARAAVAGVPPELLEVRTTPSAHAMQFDAPEFVSGSIVAFARRLLGATAASEGPA